MEKCKPFHFGRGQGGAAELSDVEVDMQMGFFFSPYFFWLVGTKRRYPTRIGNIPIWIPDSSS
jgi:hypothetical protein